MVLTKLIKSRLAERFSRKANPQTGVINIQEFHPSDLEYNCGETAHITNTFVKGEIKTIVSRGVNPSIIYNNIVLSTGFTEANHNYVVKNGLVWDPVLGYYGDITEREYLESIELQQKSL